MQSIIRFCFQRKVFLIILIPYIAWSFLTFKDYGVSIDEPIEYGFGQMLHSRNFGRDPILLRDFSLEQQNTREIWAYNHFHAMLLFMLNDAGSMSNYHLLNLLFFSFGLYVAYEITYQFSKNEKLSLVGPLFLIFTPRILGHVPANAKDPVFAVYYLIGLLAIMIAPKIKNSFLSIIVLGFSFGPAAAMRSLGYSLLLVFAAIEVWESRIRGRRILDRKFLQSLILRVIVLCTITLVIHAIQMPFVASDPLRNLLRLFVIAKDYPWSGEMLYLGKMIHSSSLPWHYPIIWILVTMPIVLLLLASYSLIKAHASRVTRVLGLSLLINYGLFYLLQPVIYDGIRHFLFTLVIFSILAAMAWVDLWRRKTQWRLWLAGLLLINLLLTGVQMAKLHPYEYVYFNELTGYLPGASKFFETDYWGAAYIESAAWMLNSNNLIGGGLVGICGNPYAIKYFSGSLFETTLISDCKFEDHPELEYAMVFGRNGVWNFAGGSEIYSVKRMGVPLVKVFEL